MTKYLGSTGVTKLIELVDTRFATKDSMTAATSSTAGTTGLVPAPAAGAQTKFLRGDGTWQTVTATVDAITASEIATAWSNISINSASQDGLIAGDLYVTGDVHAAHVYNAVYNDYAEFFPKGEETEPGDVIVLDIDHNMGERYVKSRANNKIVVGVHTDEYAFLIGGNKTSEAENKKYFIPVSLAGRVKVKFTGLAKKGSYVVASEINGVARAYIKGEDEPEDIFGILVEEDDKENEVRRLKIKLK